MGILRTNASGGGEILRLQGVVDSLEAEKSILQSQVSGLQNKLTGLEVYTAYSFYVSLQDYKNANGNFSPSYSINLEGIPDTHAVTSFNTVSSNATQKIVFNKDCRVRVYMDLNLQSGGYTPPSGTVTISLGGTTLGSQSIYAEGSKNFTVQGTASLTAGQSLDFIFSGVNLPGSKTSSLQLTTRTVGINYLAVAG